MQPRFACVPRGHGPGMHRSPSHTRVADAPRVHSGAVTPVRRHLRALAHLALCAVVAFAVLPTLSKARAAFLAPPSLAEICSAFGSSRSSLAGNTEARTGGEPTLPGSAADTCPICALSQHAAALASAPVAVWDATAPAQEQPSARLAAVGSAAAVWDGARARAPPAAA